KGKAASFFENLVFLNQAKTLSDKEHYFQKIKKIGRKTDFYKLNKDQFFFYEKWFYPVIRELMVHADWEGNYSKLAKMVRPSITPLEAKEAVELLLNSGIVKRESSGAYTLSHTFVTSENVPIYIKKKSRRDVLLRGVEAIENVEPSEKYAAYSTVTMSKKLYNEVRDMLDEIREKILSRVADDSTPDEIYEVVLQVFPVSKMKKNIKKPLRGEGNEE
ncbi:TIGR02147 family protein, partial [Fibrobacterota bacterium]